MTTFAFIGEGVTDFHVVENILLGWFASQDTEPELLRTQPPPMVHKGSPPSGGWTLLKAFFDRKEHFKALQNTDYLIVQIDTDVCDNPGFDVSKNHPTENRPRTPTELVTAVRDRLIEWIGKELFEEHKDRFLFAIAVEATECWLLPLLTDQKPKQAKTTGCLQAANGLLRSKNEPLLETAGNKNNDAYRKLSRRYRKPKMLRNLAPRNPSLNMFVQDLEARAIVLVDDWS